LDIFQKREKSRDRSKKSNDLLTNLQNIVGMFVAHRGDEKMADPKSTSEKMGVENGD